MGQNGSCTILSYHCLNCPENYRIHLHIISHLDTSKDIRKSYCHFFPGSVYSSKQICYTKCIANITLIYLQQIKYSKDKFGLLSPILHYFLKLKMSPVSQVSLGCINRYDKFKYTPSCLRISCLFVGLYNTFCWLNCSASIKRMSMLTGKIFFFHLMKRLEPIM